MMNGNVIEEKTFDFAVRVVKLYRFLSEEKREFVLSNQLLRSGTSIGANVSEGEKAQSRADFYSKMSISLKEAYETYYWIRLLYKTDYLTQKEFVSLENDIKEIISILVKICQTTSNNK